MKTFKRCDDSVQDLAQEILSAFESHAPLVEARVKIDLVFAYAAENPQGDKVGSALSRHGVRALGIARKIPLKDRAMGRGDAEIALDGDWWKDADPADRRALLDHELHHLAIATDSAGALQKDDLGRPRLKLRHHDFEFGWFTIIAERHGAASLEVQQARTIFDTAGQAYWPGILTAPKGKARKLAIAA